MFFFRRIQNPQFGARAPARPVRGRSVNRRRQSRLQRRQSRASRVGRVQREFGSQSTVGIFVTSRDQDSYTIAQARQHPAEALSQLGIRGTSVASRTERSDGVVASEPAYNASLFYSSRRILYSAFYSDRSPEFRAALGFVPRVDIRQIEQYTNIAGVRATDRSSLPADSYVRFNWNRKGELQE